MGKYSSKTFYLYARPSFVEGMARILDFGHTLQVYNESETESEADEIALSKDWRATGEDIRHAIREYDRAR